VAEIIFSKKKKEYKESITIDVEDFIAVKGFQGFRKPINNLIRSNK
jgi:hypothetical protein